MKFILALLLTMSSAVAGEFCVTQGDCAGETVPAVACLIVKTGTDALGNTTCRKQCYNAQLAYVCKKNQCVLEKAPNPFFDPNSAHACRRAIEL